MRAETMPLSVFPLQMERAWPATRAPPFFRSMGVLAPDEPGEHPHSAAPGVSPVPFC